MSKQKIGRDAKTGEFISVEEAKRRPDTSTVETIKREDKKPAKKEEKKKR